MSLITLTRVSRFHDFRPVLEGIDLAIGEGERVGVLGANGAGKTTLLRLLAGLEAPDEGERTAKKDLTLGVLEQAPHLEPGRSVRDAVRGGLIGRADVLAELERLHAEFERAADSPARLEALLTRQAALEARLDQLGGHDVEHAVDALMRNLGLPDPDAMCERLSGGEQRRVALARLLIGRPELLLLDEPTNHLDALVIEWLEDYLLETKVPLVLVTHDRYFLDRIVNRIVEIERGKLTEYAGGYSWYLFARSERKGAEAKAEGNRQSLLRRETAWARRGPPARTTKSKARLERYQGLVASAPPADSGGIELTIPPGPRLGEKVLRCHELVKRVGGRTLFAGVELDLRGGMRLGIVGPNGAGKTTFLRVCLGELAPDGGSLVVGETVRFSAIDQSRTDLDPKKSVLQEVADDDQQRVKVGDQSLRVESFLERLLFPGPRKHALIETLSGGEKNRVLLAKLLLRGGNILVLDEPTNDLDLETLRILEEALIAFPGVALIVSHDRWFLDRVATHILHLDGTGRARVHEGDLSSLIEKMAMESAAAPPAKRGTRAQPGARGGAEPKAAARGAAGGRKLTWKEQQEHAALPEQIAAAEAEAATLDRRFEDAALYAGPRAERETLQARRAELQRQIARAWARWEELEALGAGGAGGR